MMSHQVHNVSAITMISRNIETRFGEERSQKEKMSRKFALEPKTSTKKITFKLSEKVYKLKRPQLNQRSDSYSFIDESNFEWLLKERYLHYEYYDRL